MSISKPFIYVSAGLVLAQAMMSCCCEPAPDECRSGWITDSLTFGYYGQVRLDSVVIEDGLDRLTANPSIQSVVLARNGVQTVAWGNTTDSHYVASVTKSVISMLVGIALKKKWIDDIDDPIRNYLPTYFENVTDPVKRQITIRHLLTMQHGFQWNESSDRLFGDYVQFAVDLPMDTIPGTKFVYSSASYHLLSAILTRASGRSTLEVANAELFGPLDIGGVTWLADPQGVYLGGVGLYLKPRDMAKIAMLAAQCGEYHFRSIVPASWVRSSTSVQVDAGWPYGGQYGFGWWVTAPNGFEIAVARGFGGQNLYVIPSIATVVTTTGSSETLHAAADSFVYQYVLSAIRDSLYQGGL